MKALLILSDAPYGSELLTTAGSHRSSLDELAQWTNWADKVLVF